MSGGGPSPSWSNRFEELSCEALTTIVFIASPNEDALEKLNIGSKLFVVIDTEYGPIRFIDDDGNSVGSVLSSFNPKLLSCINNGFSYEATIILLNGGTCKVKIEHI